MISLVFFLRGRFKVMVLSVAEGVVLDLLCDGLAFFCNFDECL